MKNNKSHTLLVANPKAWEMESWEARNASITKSKWTSLMSMAPNPNSIFKTWAFPQHYTCLSKEKALLFIQKHKKLPH